MKSATLPRAEDKRIVRSALPSSKIFTAAVGRLYVSFPNSDSSWKYSGLWGAVAFCKDRNKNDSYFIRIVDLEDERGVVWEQELYNGFDYVKDCAFFHTFITDDYLAGILFVHQGEADVFYEKLFNRDHIKVKEGGRSQKSSDIGFVSYTPGRGFSVENNDPEILEILKELEKLEDFSAADIAQNQDLVHDFIRQYRKKPAAAPPTPPPSTGRRAPPPPPPPSRRSTTNRNNLPPPPIPPMNHRSTSPVPPPPPPMMNRNTSAPPPPVPNRGMRQTPSMSSFNSTTPPPSPPPPAMNSGVPPPPPAPPAPVMGGPPPPPPAPPMGSPASSPIPKTTLPPSSDGRNDLMAAIRSTGGFGNLKKGGTLRAVPKTNTASRSVSSVSTSSNKNASMASSLAAVLQQRKTAMQSDDEDDDDDDDWK